MTNFDILTKILIILKSKNWKTLSWKIINQNLDKFWHEKRKKVKKILKKIKITITQIE